MDIQIKRGNRANFESVTLKAGEPAFLLDEGKLYIGDGVNKILINEDIPPIPDVSNLATKTELNQALVGLASETYVTGKIADLNADISNRGYLTEITKVDGGTF